MQTDTTAKFPSQVLSNCCVLCQFSTRIGLGVRLSWNGKSFGTALCVSSLSFSFRKQTKHTTCWSVVRPLEGETPVSRVVTLEKTLTVNKLYSPVNSRPFVCLGGTSHTSILIVDSWLWKHASDQITCYRHSDRIQLFFCYRQDSVTVEKTLSSRKTNPAAVWVNLNASQGFLN